MAFRLLQSIFSGSSQPGKFDKELMPRGIERVVDGTDPRLRAVSHYRRKPWDPVERAIDKRNWNSNTRASCSSKKPTC